MMSTSWNVGVMRVLLFFGGASFCCPNVCWLIIQAEVFAAVAFAGGLWFVRRYDTQFNVAVVVVIVLSDHVWCRRRNGQLYVSCMNVPNVVQFGRKATKRQGMSQLWVPRRHIEAIQFIRNFVHSGGVWEVVQVFDAKNKMVIDCATACTAEGI